MKKNIIIIILSALVIGLVGYFVYDNFLKKDVVNELSTKKKVDNNEIDKENDYSDTNDDTEYAFSVEELSELKKNRK